MKRLHVHVAVANLAESITFYQQLFAQAPTVVQTDYAKWMLDDPRVNFAISQRGAKAGLNHLGIQVESAEELAEMNQRLQALAAPVVAEANTACCYARSDKYWVNDPSGLAWETFHTLTQIPLFNDQPEAGGCCTPAQLDPAQVSLPIAPPAARSVCCGGA